MTASVDLLVASSNAKKLIELKELLSDLPFRIFGLRDFPKVTLVAETEKTFEGNALFKARGYADQTGLLTVAEDSGICCDALDGAPGIYSARFSGERATDHGNNQKLLRLLDKVPDNCRGAHYVSVIAVAEPHKVIGIVTGKVHGYISRELRGTSGFGYDPLFFYPHFNKTFGEISLEMKQKVSHRARAFEKARLLLEDYLRLKVRS